MRICASRRKTGLLRQTIVATWRKRGQMRTRQASPDPGPLQGSLLHAPRSGCQNRPPFADRPASYRIGGDYATAGFGRARPMAVPCPFRSARPRVGHYRKMVRPEGRTGFITRPLPGRHRWLRPPRPQPVQPGPANRTGSAFPTRSARRRCGGGWRGTPDRYRPGSGGRR